MKIRFILVLLTPVLFLRCATVVHGTQVIRFRDSVTTEAIVEEQPLLPSRPKLLLPSGKRPKSCSFDFFGDFKMDGISHEYHVDGHPVHPPAMHVPLHPSIVLGLHHYKLVPTGSKLLLLKRSIPNNKGSPAPACISTHSKQLQFQTNDPNFYTCIPFAPTNRYTPVAKQRSQLVRVPLFTISVSYLLSRCRSWDDPIPRILSLYTFDCIPQSINIGVQSPFLYPYPDFCIKQSADHIHAPPG